ncbi:DNA-binding protein [Candidatus Woesearchaeota archaeon]|nr:MAG: DNA-binding protein [Candidatus Woesearchaeota archaeon]
MNINDYFNDGNLLDKQIEFYIKKNQLIKISENPELIRSYLDKAKHNLDFFTLNKNQGDYNDWLIVILYYVLYICALALLAKKNFMSKNHTATLLFLIKEYSIDIDEAKLINELSVSKDDAELYTNLKFDRHNASYSTKILFSDEKIEEYRFKVVEFMQKTIDLVK